MASDWLTAVLAAKQKACLKIVLVNNDLLITFSICELNPRCVIIDDLHIFLKTERSAYTGQLKSS